MATSAAAGTRTEPPSSRGPAETGTAETGTAGNGPAEARSRDRDEAVKAAWHVLISAKVESWNALERELGESHGLGVSDFEVLDHLAARPDGCRAQSLADAVHLSQSALSRLADRLERHGLVERANCADDRRGINLALTPAGLDKHDQALRTYCDVLGRTLPPELVARFE